MTLKRRYIVAFAILMLGVLCLSSCKKKLPDPPSYMDMTLTVEIAQWQEVWEAFPPSVEKTTVFENPETLGKPFVPTGARCIDICAIGQNAIYISYQMDGILYITTYFSDGRIEKGTRVLDETSQYYNYLYSINSESNELECENLEESRKYWWQWWKR